MSQHLDSDQINRLWQHAAHSQNRFDNRLNFFLVFESVLLGVVGVLYSRPSPAKIMLIALICLGFVLTVFWGYIQARERYLLNDLEAQLKEVAHFFHITLGIWSSFTCCGYMDSTLHLYCKYLKSSRLVTSIANSSPPKGTVSAPPVAVRSASQPTVQQSHRESRQVLCHTGLP